MHRQAFSQAELGGVAQEVFVGLPIADFAEASRRRTSAYRAWFIESANLGDGVGEVLDDEQPLRGSEVQHPPDLRSVDPALVDVGVARDDVGSDQLGPHRP